MLKHLTHGDIAPDDLTPYWNKARDGHFPIWACGPDDRWIRLLIEHIIAKGYSQRMYPYMSIVALLISVPDNGLINYDRTLRVRYDNDLHQVVILARLPGPVVRETACPASETIDTFEHFLNEHPDWSSAVRP